MERARAPVPRNLDYRSPRSGFFLWCPSLHSERTLGGGIHGTHSLVLRIHCRCHPVSSAGIAILQFQGQMIQMYRQEYRSPQQRWLFRCSHNCWWAWLKMRQEPPSWVHSPLGLWRSSDVWPLPSSSLLVSERTQPFFKKSQLVS